MIFFQSDVHWTGSNLNEKYAIKTEEVSTALDNCNINSITDNIAVQSSPLVSGLFKFNNIHFIVVNAKYS